MSSVVCHKNNKYRLDIDGLRAIAVLSVFLFHLHPGILPGGYLGVDVFFVISGYLITGIIVGEIARDSFSLKNFFARRIKRIFPALFVVVFFTGCIATFLLTPESYVNFMDSARYASSQLSNIFFSREVGYFSEGFAEQPLLHTWSLGVEEQFYLFWPLLILLFAAAAARLKKSGIDKIPLQREILYSRVTLVFFIIIALVSFCLCFFLADYEFQLAFYMFYARAWEFCFGAVLALRIIPSPNSEIGRALLGAIGFLLLVAGVLLVGHYFLGLSFLKFGVILPCLGASLVILSGQRQLSAANKILAARLPVFIGKISYSLYLYHWPVIIFYKSLTGQHELSLFATLVIFFIALLCSIVSYYFVEQPCRRTTLHEKYVFIGALLIIVTFVQCSKYLKQYENAEWRIQQYKTIDTKEPPIIPRGCSKQNYNGVTYYDCRVASTPERPTVALVGDSHSPHYSHGVVSWARENDVNAIFLSVPGCSMLVGDISLKSMMDSEHEENCRTILPFFNSLVFDRPDVQLILLAQRFDLFVNGKGFLTTTPQIIFRDKDGHPIVEHEQYYEGQLIETVKQIREQEKDVILLKQVPILGNTKACDYEPKLKKVLGFERECYFDEAFLTKWQLPSMLFVDRFAQQNKVGTIDPFLYINSPLQDGVNIYSNVDHLNTYGYEFVEPFVMDELDKQVEVTDRIRVRK